MAISNFLVITECFKETIEMDELKFYETMSVLKLLTCDNKVFTGYVRNKRIVKAFKEINCAVKFPIYGRMLAERFEEELAHQNLIEKAVLMLRNCLPPVGLCDLVLKLMLFYMKKLDLCKLQG